MADLNNLYQSSLPKVSSQRIWQWRPKRWRVAVVIMAIILVVGSAIIRFLPEEYKGDSDVIYNFNIVALLLFAVWAAFSEREWPIWKRILWIIGLWLAHGFIQLIPFGIITGPMGVLVNNASIASIILAFFTMRRSNFFVEPAPDANESWLGIRW